jgi:GNAT superfamily N-acetyltransferase
MAAVADVYRGEFRVSSEQSGVDFEAVHAFLSTCYWAEDIPRELLAKAIANSIPFSLWHLERQIGFARVVTDRATYAYLADVYVLAGYRRQGLGQWLMEVVLAHPDLQGLRRFELATRDAHRLYARVGFGPLLFPDRHMEINRPGLYRQKREAAELER